MTPKYWAGIFAVMLAIFIVGSVAIKGVNKGKMFVENNLPAALGLMMKADFKVDRHHLGDVERLQLMRSTPGKVDSAVLTVKADSTDEDVQALFASTCRLRIISAQPISSRTTFACTSDRDSAKLNLVRFGHITMMPQGKTVVLYVNGDNASDLSMNAYKGVGSSDSGEIDIVAANDNFSLTVNGREFVRASGNDNGGSLVIRDANGKPIVQINGDDKGGSVKVTDASGKPIVDIHGTSKKDTVHH